MSYADFSWYHGNLSWLPQRTIFLTRSGSHAYGTALPTSDVDLRGIAIAPRRYYLGFNQEFEQAQVQDPVDATVYDVRKFFKLAADNNPNILELLFTDPQDWIVPSLDDVTRHHYFDCPKESRLGLPAAWMEIYNYRNLFLSQRVQHTFSGYAVAQLKRIRSHRGYLLNPPRSPPAREDFGLRDGQRTLDKDQLAVVNAKVRKMEDEVAGETGATKDVLEQIEGGTVASALHELGLSPNLLEVVLAERRYGNACKAWAQYQTHLRERNPARAELEARFGYDTKHAMHLVRLMRMAVEILKGKGVLVRRPDAEQLLQIRAGAWSYEKLEEFAADVQGWLPTFALNSPLPKAPDRKQLDRILVDVISSAS